MPLFPPSSGGSLINEVTADPSVPAGTPWVLYNPVIGQPIGLLLALTYGGPAYEFSYKTTEGPVVRTVLQ